MSFSYILMKSCFKYSLIRPVVSINIQVRWKKIPRRKPKWLPTAPSKLYRIAEHPYVSPEEAQWREEALEDYYRKVDSLRKMFKEELKENPGSVENVLEQKRKEEEEFQLLLEENKKENERIKAIREETMEALFQKEVSLISEKLKVHNESLERKKLKIEEIVKKEKEKTKQFITYGNIEEKIEEALDNPINVGFAISLDGKITWDGTPPPEFKNELQRQIAESLSNQRHN